MSNEDRRDVYRRMRSHGSADSAETYATWIAAMDSGRDDFNAPAKLRGALAGNLTSMLEDIKTDDGREPRHYLIAALIGTGEGSTSDLTERQVKFLLGQLTDPIEDGYVINREKAQIAQDITRAAVLVLDLPLGADEPEEAPPTGQPEPQPEPQEDDTEIDTEERHMTIDDSSLPEFKTVSMKYLRKFGAKVANGDYHNIEVEMGVWFDVENSPEIFAKVDATWDYLKEQVKEQMEPVVKAIRHPVHRPQGLAPEPPVAEMSPTALQSAPSAPVAPAAPVAPSAPAAPAAPQAPGNGDSGNGNGGAGKAGTHPVTKIAVDAEGKLSVYVSGMKWPFTDSRGADVYVGHFDENLGWSAAHFYPGALYQGTDISGLQLDWEKHGKYYDIMRIHA